MVIRVIRGFKPERYVNEIYRNRMLARTSLPTLCCRGYDPDCQLMKTWSREGDERLRKPGQTVEKAGPGLDSRPSVWAEEDNGHA